VGPIYKHRNYLIGCVGVAATIFSFEMDDREILGRQVVETANQISHNMDKTK
jgi:DNA-binding IclR family transcriptional regulator